MKPENKHPYDKGGYVVMSDLPADQQEPFWRWIIDGGQTRPVLEQEGKRATDCAYVGDYEHWYGYWTRGQQAPILD